MDKYDVVIGIEIHAELNTKTKVFCSCKNEFGSKPNTNCCPVCIALPGALPVLNKQAVLKTIAAGLVTDCTINEFAIFERKHYFYPDLSKAYQISQLVKPSCENGYVELKSGKKIRINNIHLEEDAGKLTHDAETRESFVDYNRGGVPLIEIVTEPDFSSKEEVVEFLEEIRSRLIYADVANCKMEEGGMRCDVNLSLKPKGSSVLGNRTETKNLNSFRNVQKAIEWEIKSQTKLLDEGKEVKVETRKFDVVTGETSSMRSKEEAQDYRYFPDPDLYALNVSKQEIENVKNSLPKLACVLVKEFVEDMGLAEYDAEIIAKDKAVADYFLECVKLYNNPIKISNWIRVDLLKLRGVKDEMFGIEASKFVKIVKMVEDKIFGKSVGLQLLEKVFQTDKEVDDLVKEMGLLATVSDDTILEILNRLVIEKPTIKEDYAQNSERVAKFIFGYVMKNTQGKAKVDAIERIVNKFFN